MKSSIQLAATAGPVSTICHQSVIARQQEMTGVMAVTAFTAVFNMFHCSKIVSHNC